MNFSLIRAANPRNPIVPATFDWSSIDGSRNASVAPQQHPTLLHTYHPSGQPDGRNKERGYQPPWNVAGVDYPVGPPASQSYTTPSVGTVPSGSSYSGGIVTVTGSNVVFDGFDFSAVSPGVLIISSGASAIVRRCKFKVQTTNTIYLIQGASGCGNLTVEYCIFDGNGNNFPQTATGGASGLVNWGGAGSFLIQYCWLKSCAQHAIEIGVSDTGTPTIQYNLIENCGFWDGTGVTPHVNFTQFNQLNNKLIQNTVVQFNCMREAPTSEIGGNYTPNGQLLQVAPGTPSSGVDTENTTVNNNVVMAPTGTSVGCCIAFYGQTGTAFNLATATQNYFDGGGALAIWDTTSGNGAPTNFSFSGNIDMTTGGTTHP